MASRFEERPDETNLITPEVAERIVERFAEMQAERQRVEAAEKERLASMTRVQELADLLGTTSDEIETIAKEVQGSYVKKLAPTEPMSRFPVPEATSTWPIHLAYICVIGVIAVWAAAPKNPVLSYAPGGPMPYVKSPEDPMHSAVSALQFDPYLKGYTREMSPFLNMGNGVPTQVVTAPSVTSPPPGFQISVVTPLGRKTIYGSVGYPESSRSPEMLRDSVRSLAEYEESLAKVEPVFPTAGYENVPYLQEAATYQGQSRIVGWHNIEIYDGAKLYRALIPDKRYAKDLSAYNAELDRRLNHLTDTKFFPNLPPGNLRPNSIQLKPTPALPRGTSMMVWNGEKTVWAQGTALEPTELETRASVSNLVSEATKLLKPLMRSGEDHLQVELVYPGGEYYNNWPLDSAKGYPPKGILSRQMSELDDLAEAYRNSLTTKATTRTSINPPTFSTSPVR